MKALQRSMNLLRSQGWLCAKAEHWNAFAHVRQDLFGFIDLVGLSPPPRGRIYAIQVVNTHLQEHIDKIKANPAAKKWTENGGVILIHDWRARVRGGRKRWEVTIHEIDP